jgi:hypothetical protein
MMEDENETFIGNGSLVARAMREVDEEIAARLAALELLDPSQKRPIPKARANNHGDFMEWEGYLDLGVQPFRARRTLGFVGTDVWRSRN